MQKGVPEDLLACSVPEDLLASSVQNRGKTSNKRPRDQEPSHDQQNRDSKPRYDAKSRFYRRDWYFTGGVTRFSRQERNKLQIDDVGAFSTTHADDAKIMSELIADLPGLSERDLGRKPDITDGCACCGGNAISFVCCGLFRKVIGVEVEALRAGMLRHNVHFAKSKCHLDVETEVLCGSYLDLLASLKQDVVFLDPPWGGVHYRKEKCVSLHLSGRHLADIVADLYKSAGANGTKYVVLKVPRNFNIADMRKRLGEAVPDFRSQPEEKRVQLLKRFKKIHTYYVEFPLLLPSNANAFARNRVHQ